MAGLGCYPCSRLRHNLLQPATRIPIDSKLVSYSSTITMMHGPIYIRFTDSDIRAGFIGRG